jgi:hypothetical protein
VLVGAELAGIAGALLAIPIAGAIQVIVKDLWEERAARLRAVAADNAPADNAPADNAPADNAPADNSVAVDNAVNESR